MLLLHAALVFFLLDSVQPVTQQRGRRRGDEPARPAVLRTAVRSDDADPSGPDRDFPARAGELFLKRCVHEDRSSASARRWATITIRSSSSSSRSLRILRAT